VCQYRGPVEQCMTVLLDGAISGQLAAHPLLSRLPAFPTGQTRESKEASWPVGPDTWVSFRLTGLSIAGLSDSLGPPLAIPASIPVISCSSARHPLDPESQPYLPNVERSEDELLLIRGFAFVISNLRYYYRIPAQISPINSGCTAQLRTNSNVLAFHYA